MQLRTQAVLIATGSVAASWGAGHAGSAIGEGLDETRGRSLGSAALVVAGLGVPVLAAGRLGARAGAATLAATLPFATAGATMYPGDAGPQTRMTFMDDRGRVLDGPEGATSFGETTTGADGEWLGESLGTVD